MLIQKKTNKNIFQEIKSYYFLEKSSFVKKAKIYDQLLNINNNY